MTNKLTAITKHLEINGGYLSIYEISGMYYVSVDDMSDYIAKGNDLDKVLECAYERMLQRTRAYEKTAAEAAPLLLKQSYNFINTDEFN